VKQQSRGGGILEFERKTISRWVVINWFKDLVYLILHERKTVIR
jgi:hypothetical protein